jgi:transcriptional regulator with XRE-family HTH domain
MTRPTAEMGERLRGAREQHGLSTQELARRAQISPGYLFKLESGAVGTPSPRVLHRLAEQTGVNYWTLMELAGYVVPDEAGSRTSTPPKRKPGREPAPDNARIVELLQGLQAELAELRKAQEQLAKRLG